MQSLRSLGRFHRQHERRYLGRIPALHIVPAEERETVRLRAGLLSFPIICGGPGQWPPLVCLGPEPALARGGADRQVSSLFLRIYSRIPLSGSL